MSDLRECPFCGKSVAGMSDCNELEECQNFEQCEYNEYYCVLCNVCSGGCGASSGYFDTKEKAIESWNTRIKSEVLLTALEHKRQKIKNIIVTTLEGEVLAVITGDKIIEKNGVSVIVDLGLI